ncbi:hypothetical protein POTOM_035241 [Populus tomentosa]|uniref:Pectin acetylesterase n=1 Tax=Populus tomentosa TaxID=118781 RepID=A0A8X8CLP3_POPTO|nr:hypothetical protein POTOM_035241 [Populus tomentosa]
MVGLTLVNAAASKGAGTFLLLLTLTSSPPLPGRFITRVPHPQRIWIRGKQLARSIGGIQNDSEINNSTWLLALLSCLVLQDSSLLLSTCSLSLSFSNREEDGVIQSENVFLVRKPAMVLHIIWKSRYLLRAYSATRLKKILIFIIGTGSRFVIVMVDLSVETVKMRSVIFQHAAQLYFRGQRIWSVVMEDLMSKGMRYANQALLSGCSAGGLAAILHCDEFRHLFPRTARVKCLSDAGLFLDVPDISGWRTLRYMFAGVVMLQGMQKNLPQGCTKRFNPIMCFFPQRLIASVRTPLFLVNTAYDTWQIQVSLAPASADHHGNWNGCRKNYARCTGSQISFLQGFRNQMLHAVRGFSRLKKNGLFINSCFAHCQTERQDTWFSPGSPHIKSKARPFQPNL